MRRRHADALRAFARGTRASAGIELAIGAFVLVSVAALCFDLYSRVEADTAAARVAATMADYVSRGPDTAGGTLDGKALEALGAFLRERELGASTDLVFVVSAVRYPEGRGGEVLWSDDTLRFGDATVTAALAAGCTRVEDRPASAWSPGNLDEVEVIVEVCARPGGVGALVAGDIYRLHVLPVRAPEKGLPAPVHAWRIDGAAGAAARA